MSKESLSQKFHHENWPTAVFYAPLFLYYLYNSLKFRKLNYFTAVNPALDTGGLCAFSKFESFKLLPEEVVPKTIILQNSIYNELQLKELLLENKIEFPLVAKPDQGERGFLVSKVETLRELAELLSNKTLSLDFLIQEYIEWPLELGVFLMRKEGRWSISSLTSKEFLSVTGDGFKSISELMEADSRGRKYFEKHMAKIDEARIPKKNEVVVLEPIGNHCRGTAFVNECSRIGEDINELFHKLLENVKGVNYCRLDLRTPSWEKLLEGELKIMEVNGVSAEPGHIYDSSVSLVQAYKDLFSHWSKMASIAKNAIAKGESTEKLSYTVGLVKNHMKRKKDFMKIKKSVVDVMGCKALDLNADPIDILKRFSAEELIKNHKCCKSNEGYERTVLYKNKKFEIVFCHWRSGDQSPVHLHPDANCWFRCLEGDMLEVRDMGQKQIALASGDIGHIEDSMGAHQMLNLSGKCAYSVHIYENIKASSPIKNKDKTASVLTNKIQKK